MTLGAIILIVGLVSLPATLWIIWRLKLINSNPFAAPSQVSTASESEGRHANASLGPVASGACVPAVVPPNSDTKDKIKKRILARLRREKR